MSDDRNTNTWYLWLPVIFGVVYMWRDSLMIDIGEATIAAALIAGAIAIFNNNRSLKRDSKAIDKVGDNTADMKPKVDSIDGTVKTMATGIIKVEERTSKIDAIATAITSFNHLKDSSNVRQDEMMAQLAKLFDTNARLEAQHKLDQQEIVQLTLEKVQLQAQIDALQRELKEERAKGDPTQDYEFEI